MLEGIKIPGENFQGGSGGAGDEGLLQALAAEETGSSYNYDQNTVLDDFNEVRGTLVNTERQSSKLQLISGQTTGSYTRAREVTTVAGSVSGFTRISPTTAAPKNIAVAGNTFVFDGDVSNLFQVGEPVLLMKEVTTDDVSAYVALTGNDGLVAKLAVADIDYDPVLNQCSVQLTNTESLDLSLGLLASEYRDKLRIVPFSIDFEVCGVQSPAPGDFEDMGIEDLSMWGPKTLANFGEINAAFAPVSLGGPVIRQAGDMSDNGTYGLVASLVWDGGSTLPVWKFYYTANGGNSWSLLAFTDSFASTWAYSSAEQALHGYVNAFVQVANNGKVFVAYSRYIDGTNAYHVRGAYADLSIGSPVMTGSAATGVDSQNNQGTAGYIAINSTNNRVCAGLGADRTDLSFVAVTFEVQNDTGGFVRFYTNGGATYQNSHLPANGMKYGQRAGVIVSGSGSSHRCYIIRGDSTASEIQYSVFDQPSATPATGIVTTDDSWLLDARQYGGKGYVLFRRNSDDAPCYVSFNIAGTPTFSATKVLLSQLDADKYFGLDIQENTAGSPYNPLKPYTGMVAINPANNNQVFFGLDLLHPDGITRSAVIEVNDDTAYLGTHTSSYTATGGSQDLRAAGATTQIAQTFTPANARFRGASFPVFQNGTVPDSNYTFTCELQATTGGLPNGTVIATALNSYDPSDIASGASQWCHFRFNTQTLSTSTVYALVLKATYPVNASNYLRIPRSAVSAYAGGSAYQYNGTTWTDIGLDLVFEIQGEWIYDMDLLRGRKDKTVGALILNSFETSLVWSSVAGGPMYTSRMAADTYYTDRRRNTGWASKSFFSPQTGGTAASSPTTPEYIGYANHDPWLVFSTECGADSSARINVNTNAVSTTEKAEDRSGWQAFVNSYTSVTFGNQALFTSGKSAVFNTTSSKINYASSAGSAPSFEDAWALLKNGSKFAIEIEFLLNTLPSVKGNISNIITKYQDGVGTAGWFLSVNTSNRLYFAKNTGTLDPTQGSTVLTTGTRYVVKVTGDGSNIRLYINNVEESYITQNTAPYDIPANATADLCLGNVYNSSIYGLGGEIGYVKIIKGSTTFAGSGFANQAGLSDVQNLIHGFIAQKHIGQNSDDTLDYDQSVFQLFSGGAAVVDSYDIMIKHKHTLDVPGKYLGAKVDMRRASNRNKTAVGGFAWKYLKQE